MKFTHKYVYPAVTFIIIYTFGFVIFGAGATVAEYAHAYLGYLFPSLFPTYSPITEKELYQGIVKGITTAGVFISLWIINYISMRFDNKKFEMMIKRTEGLYRIKDGLGIYLRELWWSDVISAIAVPVLLTATAYLIPNIEMTTIPIINMFIELLYIFLWLGGTMREFYSPITAVIIVALFSAVSRILVVPGALKRWRAMWLSGDVS